MLAAVVPQVQFVHERMMQARKTFGGHEAYDASREAREIMEFAACSVPEMRCAVAALEVGVEWDPDEACKRFRGKERAANEFVALCALYRDCGGHSWSDECQGSWLRSLDVSQYARACTHAHKHARM